MNPNELCAKHLCPGCAGGKSGGCFKCKTGLDEGCSEYHPGTIILPVGTVILSAPIGFCRVGKMDHTSICLYRNLEDANEDWAYDMFNVPVWKHQSDDGVIYVRGMIPRKNQTFLHIIESGDLSKINCLEITKEQISKMD